MSQKPSPIKSTQTVPLALTLGRPMDERLRFIARLLEVSRWPPCAASSTFHASRATRSSIATRNADLMRCMIEAVVPTVRLPYQVERSILSLKNEHPSWGAPKIRDKLIRQYPMIKPPAISTVHAVIDRNGMVKRRRRRRHKPKGTPLSAAHEPNGLWCADYKGELMLGSRQYCYPLTISDYRSRCLLACEGMSSTRSDFAFAIFERVFKEFGLPRAIRTDNGTPFASPNALLGLSKLAAPRHSDTTHQTGQSSTEWPPRTHALTLKKEATKPASFNFLQQQDRFDQFIEVYNHQRPHQALNGRLPGRSPHTVSAPLRAATRSGLSIPRPNRPRHPLWQNLHRKTQDQPQPGLRRAGPRHPRSR